MKFPYEIVSSNFDGTPKPFYTINIKENLPVIKQQPLPKELQEDSDFVFSLGQKDCFTSFSVRDKAGHYWSSRPSVFNAKLNLQLVDNLYINYMATHFLEVDTVKSFLPEGYDIKKTEITDKNRKEINYQIYYKGDN